MPELPEVETVRRTVAATIVGRRVLSVDIRRRDVIHGPASQGVMLTGRRMGGVIRHGKQFALVAGESDAADNTSDGPCVCIHLGMTGSLRHLSQSSCATPPDHVHVLWQLDDGTQLQFRDPRRFGGLWPAKSVADLRATRWASLGPDALAITPNTLFERLQNTRRAIKAALLDQTLIAGLGNIYVDELLFAGRVHPASAANGLNLPTVRRLVSLMRRLLQRAIKAGGSTLRDYVDAAGRSGSFQNRHHVYGRSGQACSACHTPLTNMVLAGRTTVFCPTCQYD